MLNHITIMGRMTRDPELRRTGSGIAVTNFALAVDRDYNPKDGAEKEVDFIDCIAWRGGAEFVSKYFSKGQMAVVSGKLRIRNWTDKDGNKRRSAEVEADSVYFGDSKKSSESTPATYSQTGPANQEPYADTMAYLKNLQNAQQSEFAALEDDDAQLPF
jgi:single-strand DNA-binding protein